MVSAGDFRNGLTIELDNGIYQIIEFQHVKPGKGAAFVRTKLRNIKSGGVVEKTFRPTEKCPQAHIEKRDMQYLYNDGDLYNFMDVETFDQFGLNEEEDKEFQPYMDEYDGVIMWTWKEKDVPLIPEKFEIFKKYTPNTRRMVGCYLYNFGEAKQATGDAVKWQLDYYRELLLKGEIEGVVLHTNTMADLDYEAYDVAVAWMEKHGDEVIPD